MRETDSLVAGLAADLAERGATDCKLALVMGSGLGGFAEELENPRAHPFTELEGMPGSAVPGHAGRFVIGEISGVRVLVQQGRVHLYEGWHPREVVRSVRAFAALGIRGLLLTNAAGGLHPEWPPGTLMRLTDHLSLQARAPLASTERAAGCPYDPALGLALDSAARAAGVELEAGIYAGLLGPSYETPAEIRMLGRLGADAVGMSTVAEASVARVSGMRVTALSLITNKAAGISSQPIEHAEVIEAGAAAAERIIRLLGLAIPRLAAALDSSGPPDSA